MRKTVTSTEHPLGSLAQQTDSAGLRQGVDELRANCSTRVQLMALGPEPEVRACPACKHRVRRSAPLCGHCWVKLQPLAEQGAAGAPPHA